MNKQKQLECIDKIYLFYHHITNIQNNLDKHSINKLLSEFIESLFINMSSDKIIIKYPLIKDVLHLNVLASFHVKVIQNGQVTLDRILNSEINRIYKSIDDSFRFNLGIGCITVEPYITYSIVNDQPYDELTENKELFKNLFIINQEYKIDHDILKKYHDDIINDYNNKLEVVIEILNYVINKIYGFYLIVDDFIKPKIVAVDVDTSSLIKLRSESKKINKLSLQKLSETDDLTEVSPLEQIYSAEEISNNKKYSVVKNDLSSIQADLVDALCANGYSPIGYESNYHDVYRQIITFTDDNDDHDLHSEKKIKRNVKLFYQFLRLCNLVKQVKKVSKNNILYVDVYKLFSSGEIEKFPEMSDFANKITENILLDANEINQILKYYNNKSYVIGIPTDNVKNAKK